MLSYQSRSTLDNEVITIFQELAERFPERRFYFQLNRRRGYDRDHKLGYRLYCSLKMNRRRLSKKRSPTSDPQSLAVPENMKMNWSIDFIRDALQCGRRFRTFNVVDNFNREALAIEVDLNLPASRVGRVLGRIVAWHGFPAQMGPKLISTELPDWAQKT